MLYTNLKHFANWLAFECCLTLKLRRFALINSNRARHVYLCISSWPKSGTSEEIFRSIAQNLRILWKAHVTISVADFQCIMSILFEFGLVHWSVLVSQKNIIKGWSVSLSKLLVTASSCWSQSYYVQFVTLAYFHIYILLFRVIFLWACYVCSLKKWRSWPCHLTW